MSGLLSGLSRTLQALSLSLFLLPIACSAEQAPALAKPADSYKVGEHYAELSAPVQSEAPPGRVEILEFFLYTCPHCYHFEPVIVPWSQKLPGHVVFKRVPANFGPNAPIFARAHYAAESLGVLDKVRPLLFKAIHDERRTVDNEAALAKVFQEAAGIDEKTFKEAFSSFAVDNQVRKSDALTRAYAITGVPALAVAGKYVVSPRNGGTFENMLNIADALAAREKVN